MRRIGIDARLINRRRSIGNFVYHLLAEFSRQPDDAAYILYVDTPQTVDFARNHPRFSIKYLHPGGIAVHTTEFNLGSNGKTLEARAACIYRKRDIEGLALRLIVQGHHIGKINFSPGTEPPDLYVDLPPYQSAVHLRLTLKRHLTTSIGLFMKRR